MQIVKRMGSCQTTSRTEINLFFYRFESDNVDV